jgi:redox-sensitive bicupin YhaK (pirin superfamily)
MIKKISADQRHFNDLGWLKTYWIFSFSTYHDPQNLSHGNLRVFNDDIVAPHTGFDIHPHSEMEIISVVLDGEMTHKDTMGNITNIKKNDVQRMTAGTGLQHSEKNESDAPVSFFQIWIKPDKQGLDPSYDQKSFAPDYWHNKLALLASDHKSSETVFLNTSASIYRAGLDAGKLIQFQADSAEKQFLYVINGELELNGIHLSARDQARIEEESLLNIKAIEAAEIILIDAP